MYEPRQLQEDKEYVAKKLGIPLAELEAILGRPGTAHSAYPSGAHLFRLKDHIVSKKWMSSHW